MQGILRVKFVVDKAQKGYVELGEAFHHGKVHFSDSLLTKLKKLSHIHTQ